jgi:hypothetical protein
MARLSEPAIRNYELGNRYPNAKQIEKISGALGISPFAIADPDFDSYYGLMHSLFQLEDLYRLKPMIVDGRVVLMFDVKPNDTIAKILRAWSKEFESYRNGTIAQEEYDEWRYSYPRLQAERDAREKRELRKQKRSLEK